MFEVKFKEDSTVLEYGGPGWKILKKLKTLDKKKLTPPQPSKAIEGSTWGLRAQKRTPFSESNLPLCYKTPMWKWLTAQEVLANTSFHGKMAKCTHNYSCGCTETIKMKEEPSITGIQLYNQVQYSRSVCWKHTKQLEWPSTQNPYSNRKGVKTDSEAEV